MGTDIKVTDGQLIINQVKFKRILVRHVLKNDTKGSQGKIALPRDLIGQDVYVISMIKAKEKKV